MRVVLVVICIGIITRSTANLFFSSPDDATLSVMTIVNAFEETSDELFVAGGNVIYKLSANLSQLMNFTVSIDTAVSVRGLSVSNGGQYIVACLTTGSCIGYDVINLTSTMSSVPLNEPDADEATRGNDPVAIFPGQAEGIVYTGTAVDLGTSSMYRMTLGHYRIIGGSIMATRTRHYTLQRSGEFNTRVFKAGFSIYDFTYYIVQDDSTNIRILRVCNESSSDTFRALYEVKLRCGGAALLFAGVSLLEDFPNTNINTLVLTVYRSEFDTGSVCTYSMSDINDAMDAGLTACRNNNENREVVWDAFHSSFIPICDSPTITVRFATYILALFSIFIFLIFLTVM